MSFPYSTTPTLDTTDNEATMGIATKGIATAKGIASTKGIATTTMDTATKEQEQLMVCIYTNFIRN